ncbi:hypothetical protein BHE74_00050346 [Ensete ventricosum]|nr:hypothetical protein GW17_00024609 [Ensete ventricosum]RWW43934.1 hypothetical protein BHE74_00050346 [Ensete ventricosum]
MITSICFSTRPRGRGKSPVTPLRMSSSIWFLRSRHSSVSCPYPFSLTLRKISVRDEFKAASGLKARVDQAFSVRASTATPEVVRREVSCGLCAFQPLKPRPRRIGLHVGASRGPLQLVVQPGLNLVGEVVERLERDIGLTEVYSGRHELGIIE